MDKKIQHVKINDEVTPLYETLAILESHRKVEDSQVSVPSLRNVKEAKDWVDHNRK